MVSRVSLGSGLFAQCSELSCSDVHWFNTVRISRSIVESSIGPAKLESRARQSFVLGASLAGLFDVSSAPDYLRALNKLLDDWEAWTEGSAPKGVVSLASLPVQRAEVPRKVCSGVRASENPRGVGSRTTLRGWTQSLTSYLSTW